MKDKALQDLCNTWAQRAQAKFASAELEKDEVGRRLIEHGATCYANCALELRELLQTRNMPTDLQLEKVQENTKSP